MATINNQQQYLFVQEQSAYDAIPHSGGTATVANADACRIVKFSPTLEQANLIRPDKSPGLGPTVGILGRPNVRWSASMSMAASGAAGTEPDMKKLLKALFWKACAVVSSTSCTYALDTNIYYLSLWDFWDPATALQQVLHGAVVDRAVFDFFADFPTVEFSGVGRYLLNSEYFASANSVQKAGLTAFPSRPSAPVTNGAPSPGYNGTFTIDSTAYTQLTACRLTMGMNRSMRAGGLGAGLSGLGRGDKRQCTLEFGLTEDDSASLKTLRSKALAGTPVNAVVTVGTAAGSIWTFNLNNILLAVPTRDDGDVDVVISATGGLNASSQTAVDDMTLVLT
jgi:hypothetical protein